MTSADQKLYRKAVRARNLIDPLGSMGFRAPSGRIQRETRLRRMAFALTTFGFAGILGAILTTSDGGTTAHDAAVASNPAASAQFVSGGQQPHVQAGEPSQPSHTRTRGS